MSTKTWLDYHPNLRAELQHEIDTRDRRIADLDRTIETIHKNRLEDTERYIAYIKKLEQEVKEKQSVINKLTSNKTKITVIPPLSFDPFNPQHQMDISLQVSTQLK